MIMGSSISPLFSICNMKKIITFFVSLVILSCSEERTANEAKLVESEKQIRIDIDDNTNIYTGTLLYHVDKATGHKYIVIHNDRNNFRHSINFYNIQTSELEISVPIYLDGRNEMYDTEGIAVLSLDSIIVANKNTLKYFLIDRDGNVTKVIDHGTDENGMVVLSSPIETFINKPLVIIDGKIFCMQFIPLTRWIDDRAYGNNFEFKDCAICAALDTATCALTYLPASYPKLYEKDNNVHGENCSRVYGNEKFIYGFLENDSIYVTDKSHDKLTAFYAGSRYEKNITDKGYPRNYDMNQAVLWGFKRPRYGNMVYDPHNNVYYRFVHFASNEIKEDEPSEISFCRKEFSIIILDAEFNIIGETRFPSGRYAPMLFFVNEEGLWLSENNYERTDMSEDLLVFRCLKFEKK